MEIIHIVLGKANPDRLNGVNKVVYNMASEQSKAHKNVEVWGITSNPVYDFPDRNFKTLLFKEERFPFFMPETMKKAMLNAKNAVFHLHGGWIPVFSSIARFMTVNKIKYVITPHGAYNEVAMKRSPFQKKIYFYLFEKKVLKNAYKIHSIGKSEVDGLMKIYPTATSFLLPYGFNAHHLVNEATKNKVFTIGFVGRLDIHTKGLDLLITAFAIFQKLYPLSKLWIIGEGQDNVYLKKIIKKKQAENVVLFGGKFGKEKDELISKMHVFAHPSRNEGLPTAVLEAAALGTPTIVSQATNVAEYIQEYSAGIAISNNNSDELLEAIKLIHIAYSNKKTEHFVIGARKMLEEVFSWPVLVLKYDELYK